VGRVRIYDITVPIAEGMPLWPGDPAVRLERVKSIKKGDPCNVSSLSMGMHTGTHIDAPFHYLDRGAKIDSVPLETLNGPCRVIEVDAGPLIERRHLEDAGIRKGGRVLFKTRNSGLWRKGNTGFNEDFVALGLSAAEYLAERGVILAGIDYLSIEAFPAGEGNPVHKELLRNSIVVLEGLDLSAVPAGRYDLVCLPLKISGAEGAPVRAFLRDKM